VNLAHDPMARAVVLSHWHRVAKLTEQQRDQVELQLMALATRAG
jgi:protein-disulfide isomerase-like protein with CxxC motif